jgi:RHS repeat-associated protein
VNHAPGGAVNSRFDYTYTAVGLTSTMATLDGTWTYSYDATGQLTHAVFASINPGVPSQNLTYRYDALGNRTQTIENGAVTDYVANNLNQYTSVGGATYSYDLDGNLIAITGSAADATYDYDTRNQLVRVTTSAGVWEYEYDEFGARTATVHNGQRTEYLLDPTGLVDVVGEYDGAGNLINRYTHGNGLTSQIHVGGSASYYDFDAVGSTVGLTGATGLVENSYTYRPFGERVTAAEAVANPFGFVGQYGVMNEGNGLSFMRARYYQVGTGRFLNVDPLGLNGGEKNLYGYVGNNPGGAIDSQGTFAVPLVAAATVVGGVAGGLGYMLTHPNDFQTRGLIAAVAGGAVGGLVSGLTTRLGSRSSILAGAAGSATEYLVNNVGTPTFSWRQLAKETGSGAGIGFGVSRIRPLVNGWGRGGPGFLRTVLGDNLHGVQLWRDSLIGEAVNREFGPDVGNIIEGIISIFVPRDPNALTGPAGFGPERFVAPDALLPYRIDFENDANATAAAQAITISDPLDASLDADTFELTEVVFADTVLTVPAGSRHFQTTVPVVVDGEAFDVLIEAGIDSATRTVFARFQSIDPDTALPPNLAGFLQPENGTGRGQGHVSYVVRPHAGLPTGTVIRNVALITFDGAETIATNQIDPHDPTKGTDPAKEAFNTIDAGTPTSGVAALPAVSTAANFTVTWAGADDAGGSGVASYTVFVSDNGGPFVPFLTDTPLTSALFPGQDGHTYAFFTVAADGVGHHEAAPATADATTTVSVPPSPPATPAPVLVGFREFAVGAGGGPVVRSFNPDGSPRSAGPALDGAATGGVRTAAADFTGDGVADVVVGTGPGSATLVRVLDGVTGAELFRVAPFEAAFVGGVYVAAGDLTGDGVPDLVVTPDEGGGPRVQVYSGAGFAKVADFFGIDDANFRGGARAAVGDLNGDGVGDLVVAAGFGGGPRVAAFDGKSVGGALAKLFNDFFLFEPALRNGAFVAVGDLDGDGFADLIGGGGPGGGPRVLAFSGRDLLAGTADGSQVLANFFAGNVANRGGIRVAVKDLDGDTKADLVVGDGMGAGSRVTGYLGKDFGGGGALEAFGFDTFPGLTTGVFVG